MKKSLLLVVLFALLVSPVFGQFHFSASPGLSLNSGVFGYKVGKIVPYVGIQYGGFKYKNEYNDFLDNGVVVTEDKYTTELSINLLMPTIGAKFFFVEKNKIKAYGNLCLSKPFVSGKFKSETNGVADDEAADLFKDRINSIKSFGGQLGFGVEYFFDDNFSVGGEFGLRYLRGKYTTEDVETHLGDEYTESNERSINLMPTYTKVSLNFYFGGGSAD